MASKQTLQFVTLDVFTQDAYVGNQLGVVHLPASATLTQDQMQNIAQEFNYSETIIIHEAKDPSRPLDRDIRIFLKNAEIPFAGHPTIGAACYIGSQQGNAKPASGTLNTKAGPVPYTYDPSNNTAELATPHDVFLHSKTFTPSDLKTHGFPSEITELAPPTSPFVSIVKGVTYCLVKLPTVASLALLSATVRVPQVDNILDPTWHPAGASVAWMFYAMLDDDPADKGTTQLRTRMLVGSFEDPATGTASASLAAYLALYDPARDTTSSGPRKFRMVQGVEMGRRSTIGVDVTGDLAAGKVDKILLRGSAVRVMEGSLIVPRAA